MRVLGVFHFDYSPVAVARRNRTANKVMAAVITIGLIALLAVLVLGMFYHRYEL